MNDRPPSSSGTALTLPNLRATEDFARRIAPYCGVGDVIMLWGDLGAGKTAFARAFIRARGAAEGIVINDIPSPTFTLVQIYEMEPCPVFHFDLYRLERPEETIELGLDDAMIQGISLIEWPERLGDFMPADHLDISLTFGTAPNERIATVNGSPQWTDRINRIVADD